VYYATERRIDLPRPVRGFFQPGEALQQPEKGIRQPLMGDFFMDSPDLPIAMTAGDKMKHTTREILEAFQDLLYLIREDAGDARRVGAYVDQAEKVLQNVHTGPCCCLYRD
jgi:hypothetical protein